MYELRAARILSLLAVVGWILLLFPQFDAVVIAGAVSSISLPLYRWLRARLSMVTAISIYFAILALCVIIPVLALSLLVAPQAVTGYKTLLAWSGAGFPMPEFIETYRDDIYAYLQYLPGFEDIENVALEASENIKEILSSLVSSLVTGSIGFAGGTFNLLFKVFLVIFMAGLTVIYSPTIYKITRRISLLPKESVDRFIQAFQRAVRSIFLGIFFVALVQGVLTGIGLAIFGAKDVAFFTLLAIFCGIVPIVGTALVWFPMATMMWLDGSIGSAIGVVAWGMLIVAGSDNFLRPYCLQTGIETSMIVLFLAIISSVFAFGPVGIVLGPVIVAFGIQAMHESDYLFQKSENK